MKFLLQISIVLLTFSTSMANVATVAFEKLKKNHAEMVNKDSEGRLGIEFHDLESDLAIGQLVAKLSSDSYGLTQTSLKEIWHDRENSIINSLFENDPSPYFCEALLGEKYWTSETSTEECKAKTLSLFDDTVSKADTVFVYDMRGDYYGSWHEINVVLVFHDETSENKSRTVVLRFDMHHEI